jgi:hypothetical protein
MVQTHQLTPEIAALRSLIYRQNHERTADVLSRGLLFAHYTSAENALSILSGRSLWLRNAAVMNDHSEIAHGRTILDDLLDGALGARMWAVLDAAHDGLSNDVRSRYYQQAHHAREMTFMSSLCEHEQTDYFGRLSMWRAYGGPTAGVALVFNSDVVTFTGIDLGVYASPVFYGDAAAVEVELIRLVEALEVSAALISKVGRQALADDLAGALHFALLSIKHPGFKEEREWRLLCKVDELSPAAPVRQIVKSVSGIPQRICVLHLSEPSSAAEAPLRWERLLARIIVGPSMFPDTIKDALEHELKHQGVARWDQIVELSDIPLRG